MPVLDSGELAGQPHRRLSCDTYADTRRPLRRCDSYSVHALCSGDHTRGPIHSINHVRSVRSRGRCSVHDVEGSGCHVTACGLHRGGDAGHSNCRAVRLHGMEGRPLHSSHPSWARCFPPSFGGIEPGTLGRWSRPARCRILDAAQRLAAAARRWRRDDCRGTLPAVPAGRVCCIRSRFGRGRNSRGGPARSHGPGHRCDADSGRLP